MFILDLENKTESNNIVLYIVNTIFKSDFPSVEKSLILENFSYTYTSKKNKSGKIGISDLLEFKKFLSFKTSNSEKLAIINNAHLLTIEAQNSLLKVLEDDIKNIIVILILNDKRVLLPTILSRGISLKINEIRLIHPSFPEESRLDLWYNIDSKLKYIEDFLRLPIYDKLIYAKSLTEKISKENKSASVQEKENKVESFLKDLLLYQEKSLINKNSESIEIIRLIEDCLRKVKRNVNSRAILEYIILKMNNNGR